MSSKLYLLILLYIPLSCSTDLKCNKDAETSTIKENKVEKRIGYAYVPKKDSLMDLQSENYFDKQGNLSFYRHYNYNGNVRRKKSYKYDDHGRQTEVHDSIYDYYRVFEYRNSCDAIKSTQYNSDDEILGSIKYKDSAEFRVFSHYSAEGKLLKTSLNKMDEHGNPLIIEDYQLKYEYDKNGNLLKQFRTYKGRTTTTVIERNDKGLMVKRIFFKNKELTGGVYYAYEFYSDEQ